MKTDLKDDNILAKLSQSQLTFVKHHYCLLKYAQVNVLLLSYAKNWEFQAQYTTNMYYGFFLLYPTYLRVIMNFHCIIDFILHHDLCTKLRDNVYNNLIHHKFGVQISIDFDSKRVRMQPGIIWEIRFSVQQKKAE